MRRVVEQNSDTQHVVPMAVGCLPIVPKPGPGTDEQVFLQLMSQEWWRAQIEIGLGLLPSITDLSVHIGGIFITPRPDSDILEEDESDFNYDIDYDPRPDLYSIIAFTLTIPKRMHSDLIHAEGRQLDSERFRVSTAYGMHGPVTFVRSVDKQAREDRPSTYIVLVREFLLQEFERLDAPIELKPVGPSPFWADMHLVPASDLGAEIAVEWRKSSIGYDDVDFLYDPESIDLLTAFNTLARRIIEPFSTYYFLVRSRNRRLKRANIVARFVDKLISTHRRKGIRGSFTKILRSGVLARELQLSAITAKQLDVEERTHASELVREGQSSDEILTLDIPELKKLCDEEAKATYVDRLTMAQEVANTLEGSRMNQYQVLVLAGCTLIGAVVGAAGALIAAAMTARP